MKRGTVQPQLHVTLRRKTGYAVQECDALLSRRRFSTTPVDSSPTRRPDA